MTETRFGADVAVANLAGAQLVSQMMGNLELPSGLCAAGQRVTRLGSDGRKPGMSRGL